MLRLARSSIACLVGVAVAAPATALQAAPSAATPIATDDDASDEDAASEVAASGAASPAPGDAELLLRRAEIRRAAGDEAGAVTLLADALELTISGDVAPRTEAEIKLTLLDIHEHDADHETADRLRADLLRDKARLRLTAKEVERLRRAPTAAKHASSPAPADGRRASSVEEKVLESEVFSDRRMIGSGIGLITIGLGFGLGGAVLLIYARSTEGKLDEYDIPEQEDERNAAIRDGTAQNGAGIAFVAVGGVLVLAGVTLMGVGYGRKRARLGKDGRKKSARVAPSVSGIEVKF